MHAAEAFGYELEPGISKQVRAGHKGAVCRTHWSARLDSARMRHSVDLGERADALIANAAPQFQGEREDFAVRSHYLERKAAAAVVYA